jgi:regulatory protein
MKLRGYNPDVIDQIIQQLHEEKLIDDRNYTEVYLRNLKEYRTFGYYGIRKKLMEKQLPKEYIEELLEQDFSLDDEKKIAKKLIEKELGSDYKKSSLSQEQKQKLGQKLRMRGFRSDVISKLLF